MSFSCSRINSSISISLIYAKNRCKYNNLVFWVIEPLSRSYMPLYSILIRCFIICALRTISESSVRPSDICSIITSIISRFTRLICSSSGCGFLPPNISSLLNIFIYLIDVSWFISVVSSPPNILFSIEI